MSVGISDEVLTAAHISESELKQELALTLALFQQERLTLGQASLLADRQIPIHYGVEEFREDVRAFHPPERF